jgi:translation initiation factor 4E
MHDRSSRSLLNKYLKQKLAMTQVNQEMDDSEHTKSSLSKGIPSDVNLHRTWSIWYDNPKMVVGGDWKDCLQKLATFKTVGEFWSIYNNIKAPSQVPLQSNYSVFVENVEPTWEDPANINGGKFILTINKKESRVGKTDKYWLFTLMAMLGETLDTSGSEIVGAVVSVRKSESRVSLWLKGTNKDTCERVGEKWKKTLEMDSATTIKFQAHKVAKASGRSFRNEVQFQV